jgi:SAM-dependent methyltransferase
MVSKHQATQINKESPLPAVLMQMLSGRWVSQMISVAAKLGIADLLDDGARSSHELAEASGSNPQALYRLLRALASLGIFTEPDPGFFALTPLAKYLQTGVHGSMRAAAMAFGEEWYDRPWGNLLYSVRTGKTGFSHQFGEEGFEYLAHNAEAAKLFNEAMTSLSAMNNPAIVAAYDFSRAACVVDVGGGYGGLLIEVLKTHAAARGLLFDQPSVIEGARPQIQAAGLENVCEVMGGDFFAAIPPGGDIYMMKSVIHDWDDERALKILRNCHRAMKGKSKLLLIEHVIHPSHESMFGKLVDIKMLVMSGGRERTAQEYRGLLAAAGFELTNLIATPTPLSLIEGVKR